MGQTEKMSAWFNGVGGRSLDMLGMSFDSPSDFVNKDHGRWPKGSLPPIKDTSRSLQHLLAASELAHSRSITFKVNTVVTALNKGEDLSPHINTVAPARWKLFQVLPLGGENCGIQADGSKALGNVGPLLISSQEFDAYVERNRAGLREPSIAKKESNEVMQNSYILLDENGCFLDSSSGSKLPSPSIFPPSGGVATEASILRAWEGVRMVSTEAFAQRDGAFFEAAPLKCA